MLAESIIPWGAAWVPTLNPHRSSVVIDTRLALSPFGTLAVARLSEHMAVWLPPELREVLCSAHIYRGDAERLLPRVYGAKIRSLDPAREAEAIRDSLVQWSAYFASHGGSSRTYHLGESPGESRLPSHVDAAVHERFEGFARRVDAAMTGSAYDLPRGSIIASCFRDAVALAAALAHTNTFILSALEADERGAPAICNYLEAWNMPVADVTGRSSADGAALRGVLAAAGLGPVEWSGVAFAAVHVVPRGAEPAQVFWHRL